MFAAILQLFIGANRYSKLIAMLKSSPVIQGIFILIIQFLWAYPGRDLPVTELLFSLADNLKC